VQRGCWAAPKESSSASIGELWPDIDKRDEITHRGASIESLLGSVLHGQSLLSSVVRMNENARPVAKRDVVNDALGLSTFQPGGHGRGSMRNKGARILFAAPGPILPCMRRSFVDRQY
jgi:hypothetical protein